MYTSLGYGGYVSHYTGLGQIPDGSAIPATELTFIMKQIAPTWNTGQYQTTPGFQVAVQQGWVPNTLEGAATEMYWRGGFGTVRRLQDMAQREYWGWLSMGLMDRVSTMPRGEWDRWLKTLFDNYAPQVGPLTPAQLQAWWEEAQRIMGLWPSTTVAAVPPAVQVPTGYIPTGPGGAPFGFLPPGHLFPGTSLSIPAVGSPLNPGPGYFFKAGLDIDLVDPSYPGVEKLQSWSLWWNPTTNTWRRVAGDARRFGLGAASNPAPANWRDLPTFEDLATEAPVGTIQTAPAKLVAYYTSSVTLGGAAATPATTAVPVPVAAPVAPIVRPPVILTGGQVTTPAGVPLTPAEVEQVFPGFTQQVQQQVAAAKPPPASTTTVMTSAGPLQVTTDGAGDVVAIEEKKAGLPVGLLLAAGAGLLFFLGKRRRRTR